jgi:hypothetical protein
MKTDFVLLGRRISITSRCRRRWLVALLYAGFAAMVIAWCAFYGQSTLILIILFLLSGRLAKFLGGRSYEEGLLPPFEGGDERERYRRFRVHYVAYEYLDFAFLPALIAAMFKSNPLSLPANPAVRIFLDRLPYGLLIAAGILYYTLPQTILLWTEPDMEADSEEPGA